MLTLWIVIIALGMLELFETVLLVLLLRAFGEIRQRNANLSQQDTQYPDMGGLASGQQAPSFFAANYESELVKLEDFRGKRILLAFVSPGCPACAGAIKVLNALAHDKDYTVVAIGGANHEFNRIYASEHGTLMPILTPQSNFEKEEYHVPMVPFVFVIDESGTILARGAVNEHAHLQNLLRATSTPIVSKHASH